MERNPETSAHEEELSGGEAKVLEYADRIEAGEDGVFEGLPPSFRVGIQAELERRMQERVAARASGESDAEDAQPDVVEAVPEENEAQIQVEIDDIRRELGLGEYADATETPESQEANPIEKMDQDQFAEWLIENLKPEDLKHIEVYTLLTLRPENRAQFIEDARTSPDGMGVLYHRRVAMLPQTREWAAEAAKVLDAHQSGEIDGASRTGWNHFVINKEAGIGKEEDRIKGYINLSGENILETFNADAMEAILQALRDGGYHGQVKFPEAGAQLFDKFDNIVIHGNSDEETQKAIDIVKGVLTDRAIEVQYTQLGKDSVNENGEKKSHSQLLAEHIRSEITARS